MRSREVAGLILTEKLHPRGEHTPPHAHSQPYLCFVISGNWEERCDDGARRCTPQTLIYHPPGEVHSDEFVNGDGRVFAIEFDESWRSRIEELTPALNEPQVISFGAVPVTASRIYDESRRGDVSSALFIEGLALELLGGLSRLHAGLTTRAAPSWLREAEDIISDAFRSRPSVRDVAERVGVHPVHLARAFRDRHGCTIAEYVVALRVRHGCALMKNRALPLSRIALDAGFCDQSHFTRSFRRIYGVSPAKYRAALLH